MSRAHHSSHERGSHRRSVSSDADLAMRLGLGIGVILIAVLSAGVWLVVRGLM